MARALPKLPIFWNLTPKNIPDRQKHVAFRKPQKVINHSTLLYKTICVHVVDVRLGVGVLIAAGH